MAFIQGFWIEVIAPIEGYIEFTTDPFPPGTNIYANIAVSFVDTLFQGKLPDPTFVAAAFVSSWTTYLPDGGESQEHSGSGFEQNATGIENVARVNFALFAERAWAIAQINILSL